MGAIISFILLIIGILKDIKILKIITIIFTTVFVVILSAGIGIGYYHYKDSKDVANQVNKTENIDTKITSGNSDDPVVVTEKSFYDSDTEYSGEFEIKNNTDTVIVGINFNISYIYSDGNGGGTRMLYFTNIGLGKNQTTVQYYHSEKSSQVDMEHINAKLININSIFCTVYINGEKKI